MYNLIIFDADLHTRTGRYSNVNLACQNRGRDDLSRICDKAVEPTTH